MRPEARPIKCTNGHTNFCRKNKVDICSSSMSVDVLAAVIITFLENQTLGLSIVSAMSYYLSYRNASKTRSDC